MPYIKQDKRYQDLLEIYAKKDADTLNLNIEANGPRNSGELNFVLTIIVQEYFKVNGGRYQQINDIVGALEGAKLEFYRRIVGPYEDKKIQENGDVYD